MVRLRDRLWGPEEEPERGADVVEIVIPPSLLIALDVAVAFVVWAFIAT